jgi:hypothetical protein
MAGADIVGCGAVASWSITGWLLAADKVSTVDVDFPVVSTVFSSTVIVASIAARPALLAVPELPVVSDPASTSGAGLVSACDDRWDVVIEWRADCESGWAEPDGSTAGWPVVGVPVSTGPDTLPSMVDTTPDGSSGMVSTPVDGLELV